MMTNSRKRHQGGAGRPVKRGTRKVRTRSLNTRHIVLTTHPQGTTATTDGAKAPTPRPRPATRGSRVHTANAVHTHTTPTHAEGTGMRTTRRRRHPPPQRLRRGRGPGDKPSTRQPPLRAFARRVDRVLTAMSTTNAARAYTPSRLPTRRRFCFSQHMLPLYTGGSFCFLHMLLVSSNRFVFG